MIILMMCYFTCVDDLEEKPVIVVAPGNREVMVGSKVIADCVAKGRPNPTILWEHEHKLIHETNLMRVDQNGSLMIISAQTGHSGNYTCMAVNEKGSTHTEMTLNVKSKEGNNLFNLYKLIIV